MILIVGATGNVGGAVCEALRAQGKPVRGMVRESSDPERVRWLEKLGTEVIRGELRDADSLARACESVETVVSGATTITSLGADSISAVAKTRLRLDQMLRARRGVKRWRYHAASRLRACPSIQPKHSAAWSASMYVTLATPEPLRANLIHTPGAVS